MQKFFVEVYLELFSLTASNTMLDFVDKDFVIVEQQSA